MRYIFLTMMMATMLFSSQQRQIILGSFSVESNALFYSIGVEKKIKKDRELLSLVKKYALKLEYKKVGVYNVVTLYPFENYPSLFETIAVVKKYYPKAYSLKYPAFASSLEEAKQEVVVEDEVELDDIALEKVEVEAVEAEIDEVELVMPTEEEIKYEPIRVKKPEPIVIPMAAEEESLPVSDLMLLVALLFVLIGFVIYKIKTKKKVIEV